MDEDFLIFFGKTHGLIAREFKPMWVKQTVTKELSEICNQDR